VDENENVMADHYNLYNLYNLTRRNLLSAYMADYSTSNK
jgi:hypothetical protein